MECRQYAEGLGRRYRSQVFSLKGETCIRQTSNKTVKNRPIFFPNIANKLFFFFGGGRESEQGYIILNLKKSLTKNIPPCRGFFPPAASILSSRVGIENSHLSIVKLFYPISIQSSPSKVYSNSLKHHYLFSLIIYHNFL